MKKGFTLVELIASLAIFSLAMVAISMAFFASFNTRQMNDVKQSTAGYAQAIIENFRSRSYNQYNDIYSGNADVMTGVSKFVYFNDMSEFNVWFEKYTSGAERISEKGTPSTYPIEAGKKFGVLIKIIKIKVEEEVPTYTYRINIRSWQLSKGSKSQSVRDIYESR